MVGLAARAVADGLKALESVNSSQSKSIKDALPYIKIADCQSVTYIYESAASIPVVTAKIQSSVAQDMLFMPGK